jgi:hypothetical protein
MTTELVTSFCVDGGVPARIMRPDGARGVLELLAELVEPAELADVTELASDSASVASSDAGALPQDEVARQRAPVTNERVERRIVFPPLLQTRPAS